MCDTRATSCAELSSPGAFGFTPWFDRAAGYCAIRDVELDGDQVDNRVVDFADGGVSRAGRQAEVRARGLRDRTDAGESRLPAVADAFADGACVCRPLRRTLAADAIRLTWWGYRGSDIPGTCRARANGVIHADCAAAAP